MGSGYIDPHFLDLGTSSLPHVEHRSQLSSELMAHEFRGKSS
jgi:hypothetical protein